MQFNSKIFVAGGQSGLIGTAIVRNLKSKGYKNIIIKTRKQLDLLDSKRVERFFIREKPEYVFLAAALVGGIWANKTQKADFIYDNLQIQNNVIYNAWKYKVKKLLFLGSSCIYPKHAKQPIKESAFMTGPLEETNDAYAVAKIAGIKMCQSFNEQYKTNFISVMPTNLYGPNDNFDLQTSHVIPALVRKLHEAKIGNKKVVVLWGSGKAYREFMFVGDAADALVFLMRKYNESEIINVGTGNDLTISQLANMVKTAINFKGKIKWDTTKPDGIPRKLLDVTKLHKLGWRPKTSLEQGIKNEYEWYLQNYDNR
ncbi:GDP-fucose synthetase [Candidatus Roizmanbacteria bacterium CG2_30_33_16]|uniref:GDP-L-fucose synthase n=6 Tax=Candidatus Roizmaniibacteriota TaxID=1752723 RepID=A0A2M8DD16_9BACT|nr:MAG: GDP-fucose synthetase [Candidatus Roizmanbacteria bacterium CG2_30_33_16]PJB88376.1 MAG: GDP-fucose synthetase [Candidatus Roizmanbacteria bacterium CG_4_9_14_0_8_um_filter_34_12]